MGNMVYSLLWAMGKYGIFLIVGNAGFISSAVLLLCSVGVPRGSCILRQDGGMRSCVRRNDEGVKLSS